MKKFFGVLAVLAVTAMISSSVFAARDFLAKVTFSGGTVSFDASLSNGGSITWNPSDITLGQSTAQWAKATNYITMTKTITKTSGKVYIYTDNKNSTIPSGGSADYVATSSRTVVDKGVTSYSYSGLVKSGTGGGNNNKYAPTSFRISTTTLSAADINPDNYGARYMKDKNDSNYAAQKDGYCLVATSDGYIEDVDENNNPNAIENSSSVQTAYMYVGAQFTNVAGGDSFGSNHVTFEVVGE